MVSWVDKIRLEAANSRDSTPPRRPADCQANRQSADHRGSVIGNKRKQTLSRTHVFSSMVLTCPTQRAAAWRRILRSLLGFRRLSRLTGTSFDIAAGAIERV